MTLDLALAESENDQTRRINLTISSSSARPDVAAPGLTTDRGDLGLLGQRAGVNRRRASHVLVVDDDAAVRELVSHALTADGYVVATAERGADALELLREHTPDILLLDVLMPGLSGFEVCARLRAMPQCAEIPILFVTALDDRASRLHGLDVGADEFLTKPFDLTELRVRVRTIVRLNRYRRLVAERQRFAWLIEHADEGYLLLDADHTIRYANARARLYLDMPDDAEESSAVSFERQAEHHYRRQPPDLWQGWPETADARPRFLVRPESDSSEAVWLAVETPNGGEIDDGPTVVRLRDVSRSIASSIDLHALRGLVSHKLRTPLNHIAGAAEILEAAASTMDPGEISDWTKLIAAAAKRMNDNIEGLLGRWQGATEPSASTRCLAIEDLTVLATGLARDLGLEHLAIDIPKELATHEIPLSSERLRMVLHEAFGNSLKFHPTGDPRITLWVRCRQGRGVLLKVIDDGCTLSPTQLTWAWTPLYQGDRSAAGEVSGMGMGLPIIAAIVWGAGGRCLLRNCEDGPGVVLELAFPICSPGRLAA